MVKRVVLVVALVFALVASIAKPAAAYLTSSGDIVWTLTFDDGFGDTYHGSLTFMQGAATPIATDLGGIPTIPAGFGSGISVGAISDYPHGSTDSFDVNFDWLGAGANGTDIQALLTLQDQDGVAFDGAPRIPSETPDSHLRAPPIYPPNLSLFEQHYLRVTFEQCTPDAIDPSCFLVNRVYTITKLPEPSVLRLSTLLLALALRRIW